MHQLTCSQPCLNTRAAETITLTLPRLSLSVEQKWTNEIPDTARARDASLNRTDAALGVAARRAVHASIQSHDVCMKSNGHDERLSCHGLREVPGRRSHLILLQRGGEHTLLVRGGRVLPRVVPHALVRAASRLPRNHRRQAALLRPRQRLAATAEVLAHLDIDEPRAVREWCSKCNSTAVLNPRCCACGSGESGSCGPRERRFTVAALWALACVRVACGLNLQS